MIKIWIDKTFEPSLDLISDAFRSLLTTFRTKEELFESETAFRKSLFDQHVYGAHFHSSKEHKRALLSNFYQVICNLSYDELSVFYWNYPPAKNETLKAIFNKLM